MKEIKLTRGYVAIVDDDDYEWASRYTWHASTGRHVCAKTTLSMALEGQRWQRAEFMHRMLLDAKRGEIVDHINGDPLDNRRSNLRIVTAEQNARNSKKPASYSKRKPTSVFKGVSRKVVKYKGDPRYVSWNAQICVDGKKIHIANCDSEVEAACHYDYAAQHYFGEYARCNFDGAAYDEWYNENYAND